jgi:hypothetical protein
MKLNFGIGFYPLLLVGLVAACLLTTCSTELLDEITADIVADIASKQPKTPEIKVSVGGVELYSGYGFYEYPEKKRIDGVGGDMALETFTVSNLGDGELTFSAPVLSGPGASNFGLDTADMLTTLGTAGSGTDTTTFTVDFDPGASGIVTATVTLTNNDEDEATYSFNLIGTGEWWGFQNIASVGDVTSLRSFGSMLVVPESPFVDGDEILVAYSDLIAGDVMFIRSTDGGASWSDPVTAASWEVSGWIARHSSLAMDGDTVYLAYQQYLTSDADGELWMISSPDRGITWGEPGDTFTMGDKADDTSWLTGYFPSIGVNSVSKDVYIAHYCAYSVARDLRFASMDVLGISATSIIDQSSVYTGEWPNLVNAGATLYVSYYDRNVGSLKFAKSADGGATWPLITNADATDDRGPHSSLAVDGTTVYISYLDWTSAAEIDLCFVKSTNSGDTWDVITNGKIVDTDGEVGYYTSIDAEGSDVYIAIMSGVLLMILNSLNHPTEATHGRRGRFRRLFQPGKWGNTPT